MFKRQTSGSVVCASCGYLVGVKDDKCYHCGRRNPALFGYATALRNLGHDAGFVPFVTGFCTVMFVLSLLAGGVQLSGGLFGFLSPRWDSLVFFGASGSLPVFELHRWWTVLSACWLHGGLLHIAFNLYWIRQLASPVAEMYGPGRMVIIYTVAGVAGFVLSSLAGQFIPLPWPLGGADVTVGASGSIFGLMGALVYYGRRGGSSHVGSQAWSMAVMVFIMGLVVGRADNYGHAGGFIGGYLAGRLLDPLKQEQINHMLLAAVCLVLSVLSVVASIVHSLYWLTWDLPRMRKPVVLITGASGEIGHGLIERLAEDHSRGIVTLDLAPLDVSLAKQVQREVVGSILDQPALERILAEFEVDLVFHLAALLSTRSEFSPRTAHEVNVEGTLNLLEFAQREGESHGRPVTFLYPSSIAAFGLPSLDAKRAAGRVREDEYTHPSTMYGCNKLYCEQLGDYYAHHYKQLSADPVSGRVDFRAVRFPGLISAVTVPSGGTSDYAPEMIHAAAKGEPYACFVRPDTRIPFMAMPDGVDALLALARAPRSALTRSAYNLGAFAPTADEVRTEVVRAFPSAAVTYDVDRKRQAIVDSWPEDVDDSAARQDWGFSPKFDFTKAFRDYLIPAIGRRYQR